MLIRKTLPEDVDTILNIFDTARQFMHATGNPTQWNVQLSGSRRSRTGYPEW